MTRRARQPLASLSREESWAGAGEGNVPHFHQPQLWITPSRAKAFSASDENVGSLQSLINASRRYRQPPA